MLERAFLAVITTILIAVGATYGPNLLNTMLPTDLAGTNRNITDDATTVNLNLGSVAQSSDFMKDFCTTLESNDHVVSITC